MPDKEVGDCTQHMKAIKLVKTMFESKLEDRLNLTEVPAPLFVEQKTGYNDDLNGVERQVRFDTRCGKTSSVVQSLAKWKRMALQRYGIALGAGLYCNMNAIRRDEDLSRIHSYYVQQWDWERPITREQRTVQYLKDIVVKIYDCLKETKRDINKQLQLDGVNSLSEDITFITTQELEDLYPSLEPSQRENEICRKHGSVFLMQIGKLLKSGIKHDGRAADYDDWELNGDILVYNRLLDQAFEISSMGIRVDKATLLKQLKEAGNEDRLEMDFHKMIINDQLPLSIGGGIGQSRVVMYMLEKQHIGEVNSSVWSDDIIAECEAKGLLLL